MEDTTTTDVATQDQAPTVAQPEEQPAEAVSTAASEPTNDRTQAATQTSEPVTATDTSDNATEWLTKKGIDPNSPDALTKLADMARNSERAMHSATAAKKELEKQLTAPVQAQGTPGDESQVIQTQVMELKMKDMARDFIDQHPDAKADIPGMVDYLQSNPDIQTLTTYGVLSLDQVHAIYLNSPAQADKLKQQGGQEALTKLANKQRATGVKGQASSPTPASPKDDPFLAGFNNPY